MTFLKEMYNVCIHIHVLNVYIIMQYELKVHVHM